MERENFDKNNTPDIAVGNTSGKVDKAPRVGLFAKLPGPRTQETWHKWLRATKVVEGNLEKKGQLMLEFQRGVDYVEAEAVRQGIGYQRPAIGIITTERNDLGWPQRIGAYGGTHVYIATWHLEEMSQYDYEQPMSFFADADETLVYTGATVPGYLFLDGVEEAHHALFYQREGKVSPRLHPDTTPSALYNAQDHEYEALQWKIEAARALSFPEETVETLQHCLQSATAVRREQAAKERAVGGQEQTSTDPEGTSEDTGARNAESTEQAVTDPPPLISTPGPEAIAVADLPQPDRTEQPNQGDNNGTPRV